MPREQAADPIPALALPALGRAVRASGTRLSGSRSPVDWCRLGVSGPSSPSAALQWLTEGGSAPTSRSASYHRTLLTRIEYKHA
jgi:hypothetical protein